MLKKKFKNKKIIYMRSHFEKKNLGRKLKEGAVPSLSLPHEEIEINSLTPLSILNFQSKEFPNFNKENMESKTVNSNSYIKVYNPKNVQKVTLRLDNIGTTFSNELSINFYSHCLKF